MKPTSKLLISAATGGEKNQLGRTQIRHIHLGMRTSREAFIPWQVHEHQL